MAVAVQTLLAREIADTSRSKAIQKTSVSHLINSSILWGGSVASILSLTTFLQRNRVIAGLTSSLPIRQAALAIFPAVLVTQGLYIHIVLAYSSFLFLALTLNLKKWKHNSTERTSLSSKWNHHGWA